MKQYSLDDVKSILKKALRLLMPEPMVLDLKEVNRAYIVGDLHGDYVAFSKIKKLIDKTDDVFIFLGDYVDRGFHGTEIFCNLIELKSDDPERIILLRGNHETEETNYNYGFYEELITKWFEEGAALFSEFNNVFSYLSLAAVVDKGRLICLHGGIARDLKNIMDLNEYTKGWKNPPVAVLFEILWNDPSEDVEFFEPNFIRGPGVWFYGKKAFIKFMNENRAEYMIRAHTYLPEGYAWFFEKKLLSIFSPLDYVGRICRGIIVLYDRGDFKLIELRKIDM